MMISAFCVFRVANRHTFGAIFNRDLTSPALRDHYRNMLADMIVAYLTASPKQTHTAAQPNLPSPANHENSRYGPDSDPSDRLTRG
jgi:hypothetical protein